MSSVPLLPNELITLIFTHLYLSLGVHPAKEELDLPHLAPFVFAPFLRVSRTWHALALPFFVRFVDGGNPHYIAELVKKHKLEKEVETVYFNPTLPPVDCEDSEAGESEVSDDMAYLDDIDGQRHFRQALRAEKRRWKHLLPTVAPHVKRLEVGPRLRQKGTHSWPDPDYVAEDLPHEDSQSPGWSISMICGSEKHLPLLPALTSLRINLASGGIVSSFNNLILNSPTLACLTIASYTPTPEGDSDSWYYSPFSAEDAVLPQLRSLTILGFTATHEYLRSCLGRPFLGAARSTLEHLHLEIDCDEVPAPPHPFWNFPLSADEYPRLKRLILRSRSYTFTHRTFFRLFPALEEVDLSLVPASIITSTNFPLDPPPTLKRLILSDVSSSTFQTVALAIVADPAKVYKQLAHLQVDGELQPEPQDDMMLTLAMASRLRELGFPLSGSFADACQVGHGVVSYEPGSASYAAVEAEQDRDRGRGKDGHEAAGEREQVEDEADAEGELGMSGADSDEDGANEELDWDAEDSPQFRHLWSAAKREEYERSSLVAEFDAFRPRFPSEEAFEAARDKALAAFQPFLQGRVPRRRGRASGL
ncbi:hypothetical protein JCM10213_005118 [Rhodosporidiobolus nylandii]